MVFIHKRGVLKMINKNKLISCFLRYKEHKKYLNQKKKININEVLSYENFKQ